MRFLGQKSARARNVVNDIGANWSEPVETKPADAARAAEPFDSEWLEKNKLEMPSEMPEKTNRPGETSTLSAKPLYFGKGKNAPAEAPRQPSAAQIVQGQSSLAASTVRSNQIVIREGLAESGQEQFGVTQSQPLPQRKDTDSVERYKERLERQGGQRKATHDDSEPQVAGPSTQPTELSAKDSRTDRLMFGVGVNSDAGLVDSLASVATEVGTPATQPPASGLASLDFELPHSRRALPLHDSAG